LKQRERLNFLSRLEVSSISKVRAEGKTLALLRPRNLKFFIERKIAGRIRGGQEQISGVRRPGRSLQFDPAHSLRALPACI
jgi:hypothetical protein